MDNLETRAGLIQVRRAATNDVDAVISIICEVATWLHSRGIDQWWPTDRFERREPWIDRASRGEVYLAYLSGEPIATLTIQWEDAPFWGHRPADAGYIHRLAVRRVVAGNGVGRELLKWAEGVIEAEGRPFARLDCSGKNQKLRAYYQSAGYTLVQETKVYGYDIALFEKRLGVDSQRAER